MKVLLLFVIAFSLLLPAATAQSSTFVKSDAIVYHLGDIVNISGQTNSENILLQIKDPSGNTVLLRTISADNNFSYDFNLRDDFIFGKYSITVNAVENDVPQISTIYINLIEEKQVQEKQTEQTPSQSQTIEQTETSSDGGGCLIATAAYGSEMAPQVQFLREIRDNTVMQTTSGTAFMTEFNQFYYSFSPAVADYERENPVFKEMVKITLTPLLTSLTLLNYTEIDSEDEMLGYGIGIILLNIGMYFVMPAVLIISLKKQFINLRQKLPLL